jgi:hypothetical protein
MELTLIGKSPPRPSLSKRGNAFLWQREVRRDFIDNIIILRPLIDL